MGIVFKLLRQKQRFGRSESRQLQEDHGEDNGDGRGRGQGLVNVQEHANSRRTHAVEHVLQEDPEVTRPPGTKKKIHGQFLIEHFFEI